MAKNRGTQPEEVQEPDDEVVVKRLTELGIPLETLMEPLRIGHLKGDFTTNAHPRTYPGTVVWGEITGEMRGRLAELNWEFDDTDNISRAVSPDGRVIVVAVRGNERTGVRSQHEQLSTRRRRGEAGVRIIKMNTQYTLQLEEGRSLAKKDLASILGGTWFLLYNRTGDIIRAELSFAKAVDSSGKLLKWSERLILPDIDLLSPPPADVGNPDDLSSPADVEVPVTRRTS